MISHKEDRFLFPVLTFTFIPILNFIDEIKSTQYLKKRVLHTAIVIFVTIAIIFNTLRLVTDLMFPTRSRHTQMTEFVQKQMIGDKLFILAPKKPDYLDSLSKGGGYYSFYSKKTIHLQEIQSRSEFEIAVMHTEKPVFLYTIFNQSNYELSSFFSSHCQIGYIDHVFPKYVISYDAMYKFYSFLFATKIENKYVQFLLKKMTITTILECRNNFERTSE